MYVPCLLFSFPASFPLSIFAFACSCTYSSNTSLLPLFLLCIPFSACLAFPFGAVCHDLTSIFSLISLDTPPSPTPNSPPCLALVFLGPSVLAEIAFHHALLLSCLCTSPLCPGPLAVYGPGPRLFRGPGLFLGLGPAWALPRAWPQTLV